MRSVQEHLRRRNVAAIHTARFYKVYSLDYVTIRMEFCAMKRVHTAAYGEKLVAYIPSAKPKECKFHQQTFSKRGFQVALRISDFLKKYYTKNLCVL